ncbi:MAG: NAD(P)-dependent oxidoreductase [Desulfobacteraceae bacterium]|nr:NAD(P)-dependent oxidoreductase [Desulfobacteraceae bacterium]MBC2754971.1 NAD(P)-dependent oxidoreductase [Desulfobacteraceae bacterium]
MSKKALVTGATGFIGSRLCRELKKENWEIRALALEGENCDHISDDVSEIVTGDITRRQTLDGIGDGMDVVFHLAARVLDYGSKKQFYAPIYDGTQNMLQACANQASRFLFVSSIAACGLGKHLKGFTETDIPKKSGIPYNDAKNDAEKRVRSYQGQFKNGCVIVRPSNVIGPRSAWVDELGKQFLKSVVPLIDKGQYSASLIYVDNLVNGILLAGETDAASGQTYQFRDDWDVTWKQYLTDLSALVGKKPMGSVPYSVAWAIATVAEKLTTPLGIRPPATRLAAAVMGRDNDVDTSKAQKELGWQTKISYPEAMDQIGTWVRDNLLTN